MEMDRGKPEEFAVEQLAESMGHIIIKGPKDPYSHNEPHGFDVASFDPVENKLHLWEAKSGEKISWKDLTTFTNDDEKLEKLFGDRLPRGVLAQIPVRKSCP